MILLLLTGLSIASLPMILIYVLIFVVFLALLYWITLIGGIILLLFLINLAGGGAVFSR